MIMLQDAVIPTLPAFEPIYMFLSPVEFDAPVLVPINVLSSPVVVSAPENAPIKVLPSTILLRPALAPTKVLKLAVYPTIGPNPAPAPT